MPKKRNRIKWAHPLNGRTVIEAISDVFECKRDSDVWRNNNPANYYSGGAHWGVDNVGEKYREHAPTKKDFDYRNSGLHSWYRMKDCLKYGFDITDNGEICALDSDDKRRRALDESNE